MTPEIELLEKYGLIRDEDSLQVESFKPKRLLHLHEQLYTTIFEQQRKRHWENQGSEIDPFTFMASASLRADTTCGRFECRASKLDFLSRYAALYASNVILPLPLSLPEEKKANPQEIAFDLARSVQSLLQLRPLIEAGVITPVVRKSFHCVHTYDWAGELIRVVNRAAAILARDAMPQFRAVYQLPEKSPTGDSTLYVEGPEDLLNMNRLWDSLSLYDLR